MIVFSAKISDKHRRTLFEKFPKSQFIFCDSIEEALKYTDQAEVYASFGGEPELEATFVQSAKNLKWVACFSAGVDEFPLQYMEEKGIVLTNVSGIHKIPMSEYAIAMLLQVYRNTKQHIANEEKGVWDKSLRMNEISGRTMLVLGTGNIGRETARLAKAFRMKTIGVSKSGRQREYFDEVYKVEALNDLLLEADFIISVLPSTSETKHFINYNTFCLMKSSAVFLNMGRGDVLVEDDLLKAIREEKIAHAVLDVFEEEPLPQSHPFWKEENITVTPHNSSLSPAYMTRAREIFETNLAIFEEGKTDFVNIVDYQRGY